jgi:hypothetical protein
VPGQYNLFAQLTAGSKTRYLYAPQKVTVLARTDPPRFASVSRTAGEPTRLAVDAQIGQTIVIQASADLGGWTSIATNVVTSTPLMVTDPAANAQRFYRALLVP